MSDQHLRKYTPMEIRATVVDGIAAATTRIEDIRHDQKLGFRQKREMIRTEIDNLRKIYQAQSDTAVGSEIERAKARGEVENAAIVAQKIHLMQQLEARFGAMMADLGQQVKIEKLGNVASLAEKLTAFRSSLEGKKIEPRFLARINEEVDKAFDDYMQKLQDVLSAADNTKR